MNFPKKYLFEPAQYILEMSKKSPDFMAAIMSSQRFLRRIPLLKYLVKSVGFGVGFSWISNKTLLLKVGKKQPFFFSSVLPACEKQLISQCDLVSSCCNCFFYVARSFERSGTKCERKNDTS